MRSLRLQVSNLLDSPPVKTADVVVIGGGIAGLSVAWSLSRSRAGAVALVEREALFASHSSGRNAAIFRVLDLSAGVPALALRSRELIDELLPRGAWLRETGQLLVARSARSLEPLLAVARANGVQHAVLERPELVRRSPPLAGGTAAVGIHIPGDGVMDIHAITSGLAEAARRSGARLLLSAPAEAVEVRGGRVAGVRLASGEVLGAGAVVIAAGAWSAGLGEGAGAALPLAPMRRHLAQISPRVPLPPDSPIAWCVDEDEVYYRPESGGALASPCDEDAFAPCLPPESPRALELLAEKLARVAPALSDASVRRGWACLRTFAPDRGLVAGPDPRVAGLHWLSGLGGHGMTAGVGAGELAAKRVQGAPHPLAALLAPARWLAASS